MELNDLFGVHLYIYKEKTIGALGVTYLLPRVIYTSEKIKDLTEYTYTMAHELAHLKWYSVNECYTEYMALTTLFKSDNDYFKDVAKEYIQFVINTNQDNVYNCGFYLNEFLQNS